MVEEAVARQAVEVAACGQSLRVVEAVLGVACAQSLVRLAAMVWWLQDQAHISLCFGVSTHLGCRSSGVSLASAQCPCRRQGEWCLCRWAWAGVHRGAVCLDCLVCLVGLREAV